MLVMFGKEQLPQSIFLPDYLCMYVQADIHDYFTG